MPTLKQITCSIELGRGNVALPEYRTRYGDGKVKCRVATPEEDDVPFSIHIVARGYTAPGLACHVFIDGELQCTRNSPSATEPRSDRQQAMIEFRFRQHESPYGDETFIGREWTFIKLRRAKDQRYRNKRFDDRVGTIEVIVLRCRYEDMDFDSVPRRLASSKNVEARSSKPSRSKEQHKQQQTSTKQGDQWKENKKKTESGKKQEKQPEVKSNAAYAANTQDIPVTARRAGSDMTVPSASIGFDGCFDWQTGYQDLATPWTQTLAGPAYLVAERRFAEHQSRDANATSSEDGTDMSLTTTRSQPPQVLEQLDGSNDSTSSVTIKTASHHKPEASVSSRGFSSHSYWDLHSHDIPAHSHGGRQTLVFPALPPPLVSANCTPSTDRAVQVGPGALYAHRTGHPEYIDNERHPYAVFTFEYCSPKALTKLIGREVGIEYHNAVEEAAAAQLQSMSKATLVAELLKRHMEGRRHSLGNRDAALLSEGAADTVQESSKAREPTPNWVVVDGNNAVQEEQKEENKEPGFVPDTSNNRGWAV